VAFAGATSILEELGGGPLLELEVVLAADLGLDLGDLALAEGAEQVGLPPPEGLLLIRFAVLDEAFQLDGRVPPWILYLLELVALEAIRPTIRS